MAPKVLEVSNFDKICRLCLEERKTLHSIFNQRQTENTLPLSQRIESCASVSVQEGDGLPDRVCTKCVAAIDQSYALRQQIEQANNQLLELLHRSQAEDDPATTRSVDGDCLNALKGKKRKANDVDDDNQFIPSYSDLNIADSSDLISVSVVKQEPPDFEDYYQQFYPESVFTQQVMPSPTPQVAGKSSKPPSFLEFLQSLPGITDSFKLTAFNSAIPSSSPKAVRDNEVIRKASSDSVTKNPTSPKYLNQDLSESQVVNSKPSKKEKISLRSKEVVEERQKVHAEMDKCKGQVDDSGKVYCKTCKVVLKLPHFYNHVKFKHLNLRKFLCPTCGFRAQNPFDLRLHTRSTHKRESSFKCDFCRQWFDTKEEKESHEREIHPARIKKWRCNPVICDQCGKTLSSKPDLISHIRIHTGEKPFQCRYCERRFTRKWACLTHERLHTGIKPYACSFCHEKFTQNCVRKSHEYRIHGNEEFSPENMKIANEKRLSKFKEEA